MDKIIRVKTDREFTIIPNIVFKSGLSLRATGLLAYILHLPDDWVLYKTYLYENMPKDGRDSIRSAWGELEAAGFIRSEVKKGGGRGKLREITYFVYDVPYKEGVFQSPKDRQPKSPQPINRQPKNDLLQRTKKQRTKNQTFITTTVVMTDPPKEPEKPKQQERPKAPPAPAPPPQETPAPAKLYPAFIDIYFTWFEAQSGVPPKMDAIQGKAGKAIIAYLRTIVKAKAKAEGIILDAETMDERIIKSWQLILDNWDQAEAYYQDKTRLVDINSNIQNVIKQLKHGQAVKKAQSERMEGRAGNKISATDVAGIFATIDSRNNQ